MNPCACTLGQKLRSWQDSDMHCNVPFSTSCCITPMLSACVQLTFVVHAVSFLTAVHLVTVVGMQALNSNDFSMSSEMDDPLGMQHLFEEQLSGDSTNISAQAAATPTNALDPWASTLLLSLQCMIRWLQSSSHSRSGLQSQHLDAMLFLLAQSTKQEAASAVDPSGVAVNDSDKSNHHNSKSCQLDLSELLKSLGSALLEMAVADESGWVCAHVVTFVLMRRQRPHASIGSSSSDSSSSKANGLLQLAATCLMHTVKVALAGNQECKLPVNLWTDLIIGASSFGSTLTQHEIQWQLAQPRQGLFTHCILALST